MNRFFTLLMLVAALFASAVSYAESPVGGMRETGVFELKCFGADGQLKWTETARNSLADEGEQAFLDVFLRAGTAPTSFYVALYNFTVVDTSTLTTLSTYEPATNGYARQAVERSTVGWTTLALDVGDYQATSKTVTFTASGGSWGPVTYAALVTASSGTTGTLVSYAALSQSRTLASGESLQVTYRVKLQ